MSKKKSIGISSPSTDIDPLRTELEEIFVGYPDGAAIAYEFLTAKTSTAFLQISDQENVWRVRKDAVDRFVNGISDRVELQWKKNINL